VRRESLNIKILILTIALFVICSLIYGTFFSYQSNKALMDEFITRGNSLVKNLSLNAELEILIENIEALESLAENLLQERAVQSVRIMNENKQVLVDLSKPDLITDEYKETISLPVTRGSDKNISDRFALSLDESGRPDENREQLIGYIEVIFSKKGIADTISVMRKNMFILASLATVFGCAVALFFSISIVKPMRRLAEATTHIARGEWGKKLPIDTLDEVGQLTDAFNKMSESLITQKKELEETYKELAKRERMAEIGNFSMMIAHELKNPLGIIKGSVDIISKEGVKTKVRNTMIEYIQDEVKRLNRLVEDFLSFARPNPAHKSLVDINQVITKMVNLAPLPELKEKDIFLKVELSEEATEINVDEHQIYQVLLNLFNNAIQSIPEKGEISFKTESSNSGTRITITDTGIGIPAEEKEKVFEPFFTKKEKGTGLGLAVVKKIIDAHLGVIHIADHKCGGTVFSIWLP
jgi:nitrogen fixation/metabolism regulation signal transduction histidine kinase